jgi:galactokinase
MTQAHGDDVRAAYRAMFGAEPEVVSRAPGRVNLIGEHTDYMGGLVLPAAIDRDVQVALGRRTDDRIEGFSCDFQERGSGALSHLDRAHPCSWMRYVLGVVAELEKEGHPCGGFQFTVKGDVPVGSGLSSSAALELAICTALQAVFGFTLSGRDAALLCQRAEREFVGVHCGIMDQYISSIGKKDHAMLIDCRDLSVREVAVRTPGYCWMVIDSGKRRDLASSAYNARRRECEAGLTAARRALPARALESVRDLSAADIEALKGQLSAIEHARLRHVVTENERVLDTAAALARGDIEAAGRSLRASHASLRDDFAVSCRELDQIVDLLCRDDAVAGARLTGAGFGGCVIALVRDAERDRLVRMLEHAYHPGPECRPLAAWPVAMSGGAGLVPAEV